MERKLSNANPVIAESRHFFDSTILVLHRQLSFESQCLISRPVFEGEEVRRLPQVGSKMVSDPDDSAACVSLAKFILTGSIFKL
jgi:hypothetical protein